MISVNVKYAMDHKIEMVYVIFPVSGAIQWICWNDEAPKWWPDGQKTEWNMGHYDKSGAQEEIMYNDVTASHTMKHTSPNTSCTSVIFCHAMNTLQVQNLIYLQAHK